MIPLEQLKKHSSFYQFILEEGREEGREEERREAIIEFFCRLAARRFPNVQWEREVETVTNLDQLEQLALDLQEIPQAKTLRWKLKELSAPVN